MFRGRKNTSNSASDLSSGKIVNQDRLVAQDNKVAIVVVVSCISLKAALTCAYTYSKEF